MPTRPTKRPPADPKSFDEAVTWFRDRLVMTDDEFDSIETASHATAFTVAGVAHLDLVTQVWEAADRAIAQGETLESFQKSMRDKLGAAWGQDMPWRVETIYRTNVQSAYSRGRWLQMNHPAVLQARPWRKFSAIMDSRTSPICGPCDGTVRAADDPWWQDHVPPLHHNCRSHLVTLSDAEAQLEGVSKAVPEVDADVGFGDAPSPTPKSAWQPDLSQYPAPLASAYHAPTQPKPRPDPEPPAPAPAPSSSPPEGVKGQPFAPAASVDQAVAAIKGHGLEPFDGRQAGRERHAVTVQDAERLEYLNAVNESLHAIRERFPWFYEQSRGVKLSTYPSPFDVGGTFLCYQRQVLLPANDDARWAKWVSRLDAAGADPGTRQERRSGFAQVAARHELAHALDWRRSSSGLGEWFFSSTKSTFNRLWQQAARDMGVPLNSLVRGKVTNYATKNLQERFAETVQMISSPNYTPGSIPKGVERYILELLEKGPTA